MHSLRRKLHFIATLAAVFFISNAATAEQSVVVSNLENAYGIDLTSERNLLVTESAQADNEGRLTLIDSNGTRTLIHGLPSGLDVVGERLGPTALQVRDCCVVLLAIGEGDTLRPGLAPGQQVPNPEGVTSPILSSLLRIVFEFPIDTYMGGLHLSPADHVTLADGKPVRLRSPSGERARIEMLTDLKDFRPDPQTNIRGSNPVGVRAAGTSGTRLVADAGSNSLVATSPNGPPVTLVRFPPVPNLLPIGPPVVDAVPTSVNHIAGNRYLVGLLSGFPFAPGGASIREVNIAYGTQTELIGGVTMVTDAVWHAGGVYVLEFSVNALQQMPGRLLWFATPEAAAEVVANPLIGPTDMVIDRAKRVIYIVERIAGRVSRVVM